MLTFCQLAFDASDHLLCVCRKREIGSSPVSMMIAMLRDRYKRATNENLSSSIFFSFAGKPLKFDDGDLCKLLVCIPL